MFAYPKQAEFNRVVPKAKVYAHARVSRRLKDLFVAQVGEILWKYKLSPETVNLPASRGIGEIQVFELSLRTPDLHADVLALLERAIPFPLLFQLVHDGQVRFAASYKRRSEADASRWVVEGLFLTGPRPVNARRLPLPVALDLASLYEQVVRQHIPLLARPGENLAEQVARFGTLEAKTRACRQLESRLTRERQFNRKVELNAALRSLSQELDILTQS